MDIKHVEKDSFIHTMQTLDGDSVISRQKRCMSDTYVILALCNV